MTKLLKSELSRLFKNKFFILSVLAIVVYNIFEPNNINYFSPGEILGYYAIFCSLFTLLFVGSIFRNRTVLNMLSTGTKKTQLYIAELVVSIVTSLSFILPTLLFFFTRMYKVVENINYFNAINLKIGDFFKLYSSHGNSFSASFFTIFLLMFFMTVLCSSVVVSIVMLLRSSTKTIVAFVVIMILILYSVMANYQPAVELPYIIDENAVAILETKKDEIDIFNPASLENISELNSLKKNPNYNGGIRARLDYIANEMSVGTHISRMEYTKVDFEEGSIIVRGMRNYGTVVVGEISSDIIFEAEIETPLDLFRIYHMEYCIATIILLNIFSLALFRKSDIS